MSLLTFLFLLAGTSVTYSPSRPTVGDLIAADVRLAAGESLSVAESDDFEVVSVRGSRAVFRSFRPGPFTASLRIQSGAGVREERLTLVVQSVLAANDSMKPAPLRPPVEAAPNRYAIPLTGAAALAAFLSWAAVLYLAASRNEPQMHSSMGASARFRLAVEKSRDAGSLDAQIILLSIAAREFLAETDPELGSELTTAELLRAAQRKNVPDPARVILRRILIEGDFAKFSGWGARPQEFHLIADAAISLSDQLSGDRVESL